MPIRLEPFELTDIPELIQWVDSPELHTLWTGIFFNYPIETAQLEKHLNESLIFHLVALDKLQ